jgi:hypothetical protein
MKPVSRKKNYTRLPGRKNSMYRRVRLWLGPDHLLQVDSNVYSEAYQRFYFKDIQGMILRRTAAGLGMNVLYGIIAALSGIVALRTSDYSNTGFFVFWLFVTGLFLLLLLINTLRGPTCSCYIRTPISIQKLPSLSRLKKARRIVARISTLVEQSQGRLDPAQMSELKTSAAQIAQRSAGKPVAARPAVTSPFTDEPVNRYGGIMHWPLVVSCLLTGAYGFFYIFNNGMPLFLTGILMIVVLLSLAVIALAKQYKSRLPDGVKAMPWCVMGAIFIGGTVGYFGMIISVIQAGEFKPFEELSMFRSMAMVSPIDVPFLTGLFVVVSTALVVVGIFGATILSAWQRKNMAGRK